MGTDRDLGESVHVGAFSGQCFLAQHGMGHHAIRGVDLETLGFLCCCASI